MRLLAIAIGCALGLGYGPPVRSANAHEGRPCATCDPEGLLDEAEGALGQALHRLGVWDDPVRPSPLLPLLAAFEAADGGDSDLALRLAREASARCFLVSDPSCGEALALAAELLISRGGDDPRVLEEGLAWLSLVRWSELSGATCERGNVLRYRLSERLQPRRAPASWADACGARGESGELGYRAAKAALLRGEYAEGARRLRLVRAVSSSHVIRSTYLLAVTFVATGEEGRARALFERILSLPPDPQRPQEEDDARALAALQLARLARERGEPAEALALYRRVPAQGPGRPEALLEGAVVAGNLGELGSARLYLAGLGAYRPDDRRQLEVHRLRASLEVVDGDPEVARATFRELASVGQEVRARYLAGDALAALREDPALGGLLDPAEASALVALEAAAAELEQELAAAREQVQVLAALLESGRFSGPIDEAIDKLEGAKVLLARAVAAQERSSPRLAGPAEAALGLARRATSLRQAVDDALGQALALREERRSLLQGKLAELEDELGVEERALVAFQEDTRDDVAALRRALLARAEEVAARLEMSAEVGELELVVRKKHEATKEVDRLRREYDHSMATLSSDGGGTSRARR